jgi:hypothetical protein
MRERGRRLGVRFGVVRERGSDFDDFDDLDDFDDDDAWTGLGALVDEDTDRGVGFGVGGSVWRWVATRGGESEREGLVEVVEKLDPESTRTAGGAPGDRSTAPSTARSFSPRMSATETAFLDALGVGVGVVEPYPAPFNSSSFSITLPRTPGVPVPPSTPRFIPSGGRIVKTSRAVSFSDRYESNGSGCSASIASIVGSDVALDASLSAKSSVDRSSNDTYLSLLVPE